MNATTVPLAFATVMACLSTIPTGARAALVQTSPQGIVAAPGPGTDGERLALERRPTHPDRPYHAPPKRRPGKVPPSGGTPPA